MERTILHLDMDSFFASCEQQRRPELRGLPVAVSGDPASRTVVAAASREAKKFGVRSAMTIHEARRLCPQIQFVLGDPDYYVNVSRRMIGILRWFAETIEVASIDEAFMDLTGWAEREHQDRWQGAIVIVKKIKNVIRREMGEFITASAGIADNKRLAKLASDRNKPDGIMVMTRSVFEEMMPTLALRDFCGLGPATERALASLEVMTPVALRKKSRVWLEEYFGAQGKNLWEMMRGIDDAPVVGEPDEPKSMGHQVTLPRDVSVIEDVVPTICELAEAVAARLRAYGYAGHVITLRLRFYDFSERSQQMSLATPTSDGRIVARAAGQLLVQTLKKPIRLVGVTVAQLVRPVIPLLPLDQRRIRVLTAMDDINRTHGARACQPGTLLGTRSVLRHVAAPFSRTAHVARPIQE